MKLGFSSKDVSVRSAAPVISRKETGGITHDADVRNASMSITTKPTPPVIYNSAMPVRMLSDKDLLGLYHSIELALPGHHSRIVQFASCYKGEGTTLIGMGLSTMVSGVLGNRTLFIDIDANSSQIGQIRQKALPSLIDVASGQAALANAVSLSPDNALQFDYAYLTADAPGSDILFYMDQIKQMLAIFRNQYELIIFSVSNILANPVGIALSRLADGAVLVIEAERTRAPAARQAIQRISEKKVKVIGLVFNKRRYYIPGWLYRWL